MFLIRECSELSESMWQKIYVLEKKSENCWIRKVLMENWKKKMFLYAAKLFKNYLSQKSNSVPQFKIFIIYQNFQ